MTPAEDALLSTRSLLVRKAVGDAPHAYELFVSEDAQVGVVRRVDSPRKTTALRKVTNFFEWTSSLPDVRLDVVDHLGVLLFTVDLSGEDTYFTATVRDGAGGDRGVVAKAKGFRKIHFDLEASGVVHGTVDASGWSGFEYRVEQAGAEAGRITNLGSGPILGVRTTSNDFLLELDRPIEEPLRTLVLACAVSMDVSVSHSD